MVYSWSIAGSIIAVGTIVMIVYCIRKPQRMFTRRIDHLHVRTVKKF